MSATTEHTDDESKIDLTESDDFKSMRAQDAVWTGSKLIGVLVVTLSIALTVIYVISGIGGH